MKLAIDHIGYMTYDLTVFERFWCDILGFELVGKNILPEQAALDLFGLPAEAQIRRYEKDGIVLEIHQFEEDALAAHDWDRGYPFYRYGMNHVAIHIEDRVKFLRENAGRFSVLVHQRGNGEQQWRNIFIRDYEGNWVELRTSLENLMEEEW